MPDEARAIWQFWFEELRPDQWWKKDAAVDSMIRDRFRALHQALARSVPDGWLATAHARLAAVIVLDQFSRNLYRDDPRAYANDAKALALSTQTIDLGLDSGLATDERGFLYMPFQHSENAEVQARSLELFAALGDENYLDFAERHKAVIDRFGRFPHRNRELGRDNTPEEEEFLKEGKRF